MTEAHSPSHTSPGQLQGLLTPVTPVLGSVLVLPLPPASVGILILSTLLCSKAQCVSLVTPVTMAGWEGSAGELLAGETMFCKGPSPQLTPSLLCGDSGSGCHDRECKEGGLEENVPGSLDSERSVGCRHADEQWGGVDFMSLSTGTENNGQVVNYVSAGVCNSSSLLAMRSLRGDGQLASASRGGCCPSPCG